MEFMLMAGYGDYNWSIILWLFVGIVLLILIIGIIVRLVKTNRKGHHPKGKIQFDVLKERKTRSELSEQDYNDQKRDPAE